MLYSRVSGQLRHNWSPAFPPTTLSLLLRRLIPSMPSCGASPRRVQWPSIRHLLLVLLQPLGQLRPQALFVHEFRQAFVDGRSLDIFTQVRGDVASHGLLGLVLSLERQAANSGQGSELATRALLLAPPHPRVLPRTVCMRPRAYWFTRRAWSIPDRTMPARSFTTSNMMEAGSTPFTESSTSTRSCGGGGVRTAASRRDERAGRGRVPRQAGGPSATGSSGTWVDVPASGGGIRWSPGHSLSC